MARKRRIEFPGALYHVIARGNNRQRIFKNDRDYKIYIIRLKQYQKRHNFILYAYTLMPNHIHLIVETGPIPLSKIMQGLHLSYTSYFHRKYGTVGHLFQSRYKAILCQQETYLLELLRYIHLNSVRASLVTHPDNYPWSSHLVYIGKLNQHFVRKDFIFKMFSENETFAEDLYRQFIKEGIGMGHREEFYDVIDQLYLGNQEFVKNVEKRINLETKELDTDMRRVETFKFFHNRLIFKNKSLDNILEIVSQATGVLPECLLSESRAAKISDARALFAFVSSRYAGISNKILAMFLRRERSSISNMIRKVDMKIAEDATLSERMEEIIKLMKT